MPQEVMTRRECQSNHQTLNEKMDKITKEISDLRLEVAMLPEKLAKEFDKRYASKLVEKIVYTAAGMVLTAVFGALIYLVLKD